MYYITVLKDNLPAIVSDGRNRPRVFATTKKARNFIDGRPFLSKLKPRIVPSSIRTANFVKVDP